MSLFPENDKARKTLVVWRYLTRYFPKAHREVTKVCVVNNVRYNPDREPNDIHWARGKSPDQLGSAMRHMLERDVDGKVFETVPPEVANITGIDKVYVLAEAMWRIGAQLELDIEDQEGPVREADAAREDALFGSPVPKCPICTFSEHVAPSDAIEGAWKCSSGHAVFHFNANGVGV